MSYERSPRYETFRDIKAKDELGDLVPRITVCITNAFGNEMPEDEVNSALKGTLVVVALLDGGKVVGYASMQRKRVRETDSRYGLSGIEQPKTVLFSMGSAVVDRNYQGLGIYRELNRIRLGEALSYKPKLITTTTQNPRVEDGLCAVFEEKVAEGGLKLYMVSRRMIKGFYKRRLTSYSIDVKGTAFEDLNLEDGDAFAIVFRLVYEE